MLPRSASTKTNNNTNNAHANATSEQGTNDHFYRGLPVPYHPFFYPTNNKFDNIKYISPMAQAHWQAQLQSGGTAHPAENGAGIGNVFSARYRNDDDDDDEEVDVDMDFNKLPILLRPQSLKFIEFLFWMWSLRLQQDALTCKVDQKTFKWYVLNIACFAMMMSVFHR